MTESQQPYKTSQPVVQTEKKLELIKLNCIVDELGYKAWLGESIIQLNAAANRQLEPILADLKAENERLKARVEALDVIMISDGWYQA